MFKQLQKFLPFKKTFENRKNGSSEATEAKKQGDQALAKGEPEAAEKYFRLALTLAPDFADAYNNLGLVLDRLERFGEAIDCYFKALAIDPNHAAACLNIGNWHRAHGNAAEQVVYYERALAIKPDYFEAYNNLGSYFQSQGEFNEAISCFHKALAIKPDLALAMLNLSFCHRAKGDGQEELAWLHKALEADPRYAPAWSQLAFVHYEQGKSDIAERYYRKALDIDPDLHSAQFDLGAMLLLQGHFEEGFRLYEARFKMYPKQILGYDSDYFPVVCRAPHWDGGSLERKTILVWVEQGLGDNLMMMRYLPELLVRGCRKLVVNSRSELSRIFQHLPYPVEVVETEEELRSRTFDCHCPMTSLPHLLKTRLDTVPNAVPYIHVPERMKREWADRLANIAGPKVGLVWCGNKSMVRDSLRSIGFHSYEPLRHIPGITFISLQKGESAEQARDADWVAKDFITDCRDLLDTAALAENLDLIISVDTSAVHLAGALGKPVWMLNRFESEWRWMIDREDSPWYPTLRIFRQPARNDWDSVITGITRELEVWASTRTVPQTVPATT
jgi:tetratricopeptide (TPR) repeat protein